MSIRELRYKTYRFYFILDAHKLYLFSVNQVKDLLIRFVRMSKKNDQRAAIKKIKSILIKMGEDGLDG